MSDKDKAMRLAIEAMRHITEDSSGVTGAQIVRDVHAAIAALRDALDAQGNDAADAARYRWLRGRVEDYDGCATFPDVPYRAPIPDRSPFNAVDSAIDAAMQESPALDAQGPKQEPVDLTMTDDEREQWRLACDREFFLEYEKTHGRKRIVAVMAGNSLEWREFNRQHPESLNVFCNRWPEFAGIEFDDAVVTGTFHGRRDASEIMERVVCQTKRGQR